MSKLGKALDRARQERGGFSLGHGTVVHEIDPQKQKNVYQSNTGYKCAGERSMPGFVAEPMTEMDAKPDYTCTSVLDPGRDFPMSQRLVNIIDKAEVRDSYDYLCTQILQRCRKNKWNSIMISSARAGEGKTLTSINLAMTIAREVGRTALLVGANIRNSKICEYMGINEEMKGLTDYLMNGVEVGDLLFSPGMDKMVVLPTGKKVSATSNILGSPRMKFLVDELKTRYPDRYVIFDAPHVLDMPDTLVFSSYVDAVLLVVQAGRTQREDVVRSVQVLKDRGVDILGMVLNKADGIG